MTILTITLLGILILAALAGNIMSLVEQPDYKLISSKKNVEIRQYAPMIIAEIEVSGERKEAIREGFKSLANFIFGNNTSNIKMAMTAPVMQKQEMNKWKIRFLMPKKYSLKIVPKPTSKEITLIPLEAKRFAVIRFSGLADDKNIEQHTKELQEYLLAEKLKPIGEVILAFYNPPWTLPFLRRNEVMIELGD